MTVLDAFFCGLLLMLPNLTCSGNTYGKCFPFILNSYTCNLLIFCIKLPGLFENDRPDRRMPFIAIYNICALLMYGGLACPLNLAWMETFKPFSKVILVSKKFSVSQRKNSTVSNEKF